MQDLRVDAVFGMEAPQLDLTESGWIARALQAERRTRHDLELAKQAQARLFPRRLPVLETLTYAGVSIPAAQVGGDYFDFLDLGQNRLGMLVSDVAGKGLAAGLLMASLQASIRSQYASYNFNTGNAGERLLRAVNRVFYESSAPESYASLFFAEYDDTSSRLRYVNCGHPGPLIIHSDSTITRLESTSTVLGLFEDLDCSSAEVQLRPGDTLLLYTDGITEALNEDGTEFGQERLSRLVHKKGHLPVSGLLQEIVANVENFAQEQSDDMTLVAAHCEGLN